MEGDQLQCNLDAALSWFTEFQVYAVVRNGIVPEWFHGIISRKASEDMLQSKQPGYFLIRVSESRLGYTLSYRVNDRCRHFMIDALPNGDYLIVGENVHHRSLQDLVDFHRKTPLMPFNDLLTLPCGQVSKENTDYAQLMFPKRKDASPNDSPAESVPPPTDVHPTSGEATPPALPERPTTRDCVGVSATITPTPAVPQAQPGRLYPCLELFQIDASNPVPLPRNTFITPDTTLEEEPPELPARVLIPPRKKADTLSPAPCPPRRHLLTSTTCNQPSPKENHNSQSALHSGNGQEEKSSVIHIMNFKKKFQKRRAASQENMYDEIPVEAVDRVEPTAQGKGATLEARDKTSKLNKSVDDLTTKNGYQDALKDNLDWTPPAGNTLNKNSQLPYEYLQPPPFAPGYGSS